MKWLKLMIMVVLLLPLVSAQEVPQDTNIRLEQTVSQEHKNTRKFFSDELTRQRQEFYKQLDDRATYYEETVNDLLFTAVWKLGLLWGSIVFITVGIFNILRIKLENRRYKRMKEILKSEVRADLLKEQNKKEANITRQKEELERQKPQIMAIQQKIAEEQKKLQGIMAQFNKTTGGTIG